MWQQQICPSNVTHVMCAHYIDWGSTAICMPHMKSLVSTMWPGTLYTYKKYNHNANSDDDNNAHNTFWLHKLHLAHYTKSVKKAQVYLPGAIHVETCLNPWDLTTRILLPGKKCSVLEINCKNRLLFPNPLWISKFLKTFFLTENCLPFSPNFQVFQLTWEPWHTYFKLLLFII